LVAISWVERVEDKVWGITLRNVAFGKFIQITEMVTGHD
jgi:hypothetical protein